MGRKISFGFAGGSGDTTLQSQSDLRLADADSSNYVALQAPATIATNYTLTMPNAVAASNGLALTSDTSGNLSWAAAGAALTDESADTGSNYLVFTTATSGFLTAARVATSNMTYVPSSGTLSLNNLTVSGTTSLNEITEVLNVLSGYGTTQSVAYTTGNVHLISGLSGNYTFNWTGVPTTNNRTFALTHIVSQGGTAYIPSVLQINGSGVTINWAGNVTPSGTTNRTNIVSFLIWYNGSFNCVAALGAY